MTDPRHSALRRRFVIAGWVVVTLTVAGCAEPPPDPASFNAKPEILASLREDLELTRHASDGGGTARLVSGPETVTAGGLGSWVFEYTAGPLGIADGGWLFLQAPPFWSWSTPQPSSPQAPGFTTVSTDARGIELSAQTLDRQLLGVAISGRALREGESIEIVYGGPEGPARVDPFAEADSPFWFAVDGDGDGVRGLIEEPVTIDVVGREPVRLIVTLPSVARPGEAVDLNLAAVDARGNRTRTGESGVDLLWSTLDPTTPLPPGLPDRATLAAEGTARVSFSVDSACLLSVEATTSEGILGFSDPLVVSASKPKVLWGDLHGHSNFSDGTGTPEQYFAYARDVADLDFVALTDHDHWGIKPLSRHPDMWAEIRRQVEAFHEPGRFVTLLGYEWTNWLHGHRHVLYFADDGPILSAVDPRYETPAQLWEALADYPAMTFAHHSVGEPIATNWSYPPDPELEPVTEIVSIHGSSEADDGPPPVRGAAEGHFVRDVLGLGYRLGFIGSGDGHDGHPGLAVLANPTGGLAALITDDLSRQGVRKALRERRTYATNGSRILLDATLDGLPMGSVVPPARAPVLEVEIVGTHELTLLEVIRLGAPIETLELGDRLRAELRHELAPLRHGDVLYLRVTQRDGGTAWSSPFFVDRDAG